MPLYKHPYIRYVTLDKCFRDRNRQYSFIDLLDECNFAIKEFDSNAEGVADRKLRDDIKFMKSEQGWLAPIQVYSDDGYYYRYSDPGFSVGLKPLNSFEKEHLKLHLKFLSRYSGLADFEWTEEYSTILQELLLNRKVKAISFDENPDLKNLKILQDLYYHIIDQRVLKITDQRHGEEPKNRTFHPYHLRKYNNRWFLFGLNENANEFEKITIDRITSINPTNQEFIELKLFVDELNKKVSVKYDNENEYIERYFVDMIGVSRKKGSNPIEIKLRINEKQAPYLQNKPLHGTQRGSNNWTEGDMTIRITVIPNYELEYHILALGDDVEVISPDWFRDKIRKRLNSAIAYYT